MSLGAIGRKLGMVRVFDDKSGKAIACTVIDVSGNEFVQKKSADKEGYDAVQVGYADKKESRTNKSTLGHFKASGVSPKYFVREFRLNDSVELPETHPGTGVFEEGQWVDVVGTTKGKGFQGVMKRHGFSGQHMTHGSMMHRRPGAIGLGSTPARVFKGKKMPGHDGQVRRTVQNLKIVQTRADDGVVLVSGAVPGSKGSLVIVRPAVKKSK